MRRLIEKTANDTGLLKLKQFWVFSRTIGLKQKNYSKDSVRRMMISLLYTMSQMKKKN